MSRNRTFVVRIEHPNESTSYIRIYRSATFPEVAKIGLSLRLKRPLEDIMIPRGGFGTIEEISTSDDRLTGIHRFRSLTTDHEVEVYEV